MKATIKITAYVLIDGHAPETFTAESAPVLKAEGAAFDATVTTLELLLSQMHRRYLPNPEDAAEHNAKQPNA